MFKHRIKLFIAFTIFTILSSGALVSPGSALSSPVETDLVVISASVDGNPGNAWMTYDPAVSANGRFVAFYSDATNLVPGDLNNVRDAFVKDRISGEIEIVSVPSNGEQSTAFSQGTDIAISWNGRFVAFVATDGNLTSDDSNNASDIFLHDRQTGETWCVSLNMSGVPANGASLYPSLSADGRYVAFYSGANDLVPGDTNGYSDIFVRDMQNAVTRRVSVSSTGVQGDRDSRDGVAISADGSIVAFATFATNLHPAFETPHGGVFIHNIPTGETELVSPGMLGEAPNGAANIPALSADGQVVAFQSLASNLVLQDTNGTYNIFAYDRRDGKTHLVSANSTGESADGPSYDLDISGDGRYVVFTSRSKNLIPDSDDMGLYFHDLQHGTTDCVWANESGGCGSGENPSMPYSGRLVSFAGSDREAPALYNQIFLAIEWDLPYHVFMPAVFL